MNKEAIVVGWVNHGKQAVCGETMKNQLMIQRMEELGWKIDVMDFYKWRKHPQVILKLIKNLIFNKKSLLILSSSSQNIYPIIKLLDRFKAKRNILYWVIGGSVHKKVANGTYRKDLFKNLSAIYVESRLMLEEFGKMGFDNVKVVPNFKPIDYIPPMNKYDDGKMHFVFMSRIMPEKGCDYIIEAAKLLNDEGLEDKFVVDFYGKIDPSYESRFNALIKGLKNVNYAGFLNFSKHEGYDTLSKYHAMLFPTYWRGEGFAGIFIDAYIAGTPLLASDWGHNKSILLEDETAIFYPAHDVVALTQTMRNCINGKYDLQKMAEACQANAKLFDTRYVIDDELLNINPKH